MEADIIVSGFCLSETIHGLRYKKFVADGDSSVYSRIIERVPYGYSVTKLECANHCVKNYTGSLHKLAAEKKFSPESRKLLRQSIPRLTAAARGATTHSGNTTNQTVGELRDDLKNGPAHVFGEHSRCRDYFCAKKDETNLVPRLRELGLYPFILGCTEKLTRKAGRLLTNDTSNRAELFMSLVAKLNAGKRINHTLKGSYQGRCYVAGLSYQRGPGAWQRSPWKKHSGRSPGVFFKTHCTKKERKKTMAAKRLFPKKRASRQNSAMPAITLDKDYGNKADAPPTSEEELKLAEEEKLKSMQVGY